jgi:hypothetical protein
MAESAIIGPMTGKRLHRRNMFDRSCASKVRHGTRAHADVAVERIFRTEGDGDLESYSCEFCGGFHIGHGR